MQQLHNSTLRRIQRCKTLFDNLFLFDAPLDKFRLHQRRITAIAMFIHVWSVELAVQKGKEFTDLVGPESLQSLQVPMKRYDPTSHYLQRHTF